MITKRTGTDVEATVRSMALDAGVLAELKQTKSEIDKLQEKLKELVAQLRDAGASTQEITEALRS